MNQEQEAELAKALDLMKDLNGLLTGQVQAMAVIQDALISTLLKSLPPLADTMAEHLEARYDLVDSNLTGTELRAFQDRIARVSGLVNSLRA